MNCQVVRTEPTGITQYLYGNFNHPFQVTTIRDSVGNLSHYHYNDNHD